MQFLWLAIALYVMMIVLFVYGLLRVRRAETAGGRDSRPFVSVVVAMRNERQNLPALLQALCAQDYDRYEVIVVDDHSGDGSLEFARQWHCGRLKVLQAQGHGKKAAIEQGIAVARGRYVALTDADCIVPSSWLSSLVRCAEGFSAGVCLGDVRLTGGKGLWSRVERIEFASLMASTVGAVGLGLPIMSNGANMLVRKELYVQAQLRREYASGDDVFVLHYAAKNGQKVWFDRSSHSAVFTQVKGSLRGFLSQRIRWASKAKGYGYWPAIATGLTVFLANLALLVSMFADLKLFALLLGLKTLADLALVGLYLYDRRELKLALLLPLLEFFYIFYAVFIGVLAQIITYEWKGRKYAAGKTQDRAHR